MATLRVGPQDEIYYEYMAPSNDSGCTFVFVNALTSDTGTWTAVIAPRLREAGNGFLVHNFRGQMDSQFSPEMELTSDLIVEDMIRLLDEIKPVRPVFVGLSIGGLFAARAWLNGAEALGLVLINTLRRDGPRLQWLGDALVRAAEVGGLDLFRDLFLPLLMNEEWLKTNRENFLSPEPVYKRLAPTDGHFKLLSEAGRTADWDVPYESLKLPVLVVTGLQDHVFLETDAVEDLSSRLPNARRVDMPDAGHLIPAERPEALTDALLAFSKVVS